MSEQPEGRHNLLGSWLFTYNVIFMSKLNLSPLHTTAVPDALVFWLENTTNIANLTK